MLFKTVKPLRARPCTPCYPDWMSNLPVSTRWPFPCFGSLWAMQGPPQENMEDLRI